MSEEFKIGDMVINPNEMFPAWVIEQAIYDSGLSDDSHIDHCDNAKRNEFHDRNFENLYEAMKAIMERNR